jgi:hypothetical protein
MKLKISILLSIILTIIGCDKIPNKYGPLAKLDGLRLYWDHDVFDKQGRVFRFEFYGTKDFENSYDLVFNYTINQRNILISLIDEIDNGKCPRYPSPFGIDTLCTPRGRLNIPDSLISSGTYTLTLKTPNFETNSELVNEKDSVTLNIPSNNHFSCAIHAVYPIPLNLLFGSVVYSGAQNTNDAKMFINDLLSLGLTKTNVPDYPYRYLSVSKDGNVEDSSWPPDNYSLGLLYTFNKNFKDIFNLAKDYFDKTNIDIYLYSSNGDEALLNKIDGVRVIYAKK